jgi:hypothetical protein
MANKKMLWGMLAGLLALGLSLASCATKTGIIQESPDIIVGTWSGGGQKFTFNPDKTVTQEMLGAMIDFTYEWDAAHSCYRISNGTSTAGFVKIVDSKTVYFHGSYTFKPAMARVTMKKR